MKAAGILLGGLAWLLAPGAVAQKPVIQSIVNAASYAPSNEVYPAVSPGSIATIFGENLAEKEVAADTLPLPQALGSTSVVVDGEPAPLFYVSPRQINFQVTWGKGRLFQLGYTRLPVLVTTTAGSSEAFSLRLWDPAPGIFTADTSGCGHVAAYNHSNTSVVSPSQSASPGDWISVFFTGTGLPGSLNVLPPDGSPAPVDRLIRTGCGMYLAGSFNPVTTFCGLAPGLVGVGQADLQIPLETPEGCTVPLLSFGPSFRSQEAFLSVRKGGGPCEDSGPVLARSALLEWRKTESSGIDPAPTPETFTAALVESDTRYPLPPTRGFSYRGAEANPNCDCGFEPPLGPTCPQFRPRQLDSGTLTLRSPAGATVGLEPAPPPSVYTYEAVLSPGTVRAGPFIVSASGRSGLGPFESSIELAAAPPIQITSRFAPGTVFSARSIFELRWTGGNAADIVRLRTTYRSHVVGNQFCECHAPGDAGYVYIPLQRFQLRLTEPPEFRLPIVGPVDVTVTVQREGDAVQTFSAPGLPAGGRHRIVHQWRYGDVRIQ